MRIQPLTSFLKVLFLTLSLPPGSFSFQNSVRTGFTQYLNWLPKPLFFSQSEDEGNLPYQKYNSDKTLYRRKRKAQGRWGREFERLKQVGVEARRKYRYETRKENLSLKAEEMAYEYLSEQEEGKGYSKLSEHCFQTLVGCFQRLLEEIEHLNEKAYQRGKDQARMRQADIVCGNATDIATYLNELETIRLFQQERRNSLKHRAFDDQLVDGDMSCIDTEDLLCILRVRGNIENSKKSDKREVVEELVRESFEKPLF